MDDVYLDARSVPTESHRLWDGAVEVLCFGTASGNWALRGMTPEENHAFNPGIVSRLSGVAEAFRLNRLYLPSPHRFNGEVAGPDDFRQAWPKTRLRRGASVEGSTMEKIGEAVGIASSDCPTIIARNRISLLTVSAHAGRESLYDKEALFNGARPRRHESVVDAIMEKLAPGSRGAEDVTVFIACGIKAWWFGHRWDDPVHGENNRRLCEHLDARWGPKCALSGFIALDEVISAQFRAHGVRPDKISVSEACTYHDKDAKGASRWHSHRRDGQGGRNFVLAVRRG